MFLNLHDISWHYILKCDTFQNYIIIFKFHNYQNVGIKSINIVKCKVVNKLFCSFVENIQDYL